jgi:hypothetical protein
MKKPIHGEELTIRYNGAIVKARCGEVTDLIEPGCAKFNIVSKIPFQRGSDATLMEGPTEMTVKVERVTTMGHKPINIVSLSGIFESEQSKAAGRQVLRGVA